MEIVSVTHVCGHTRNYGSYYLERHSAEKLATRKCDPCRYSSMRRESISGPWYVIVDFGGVGCTVPARSEEEAWEKWQRAIRRLYHYDASQMGTAQAAHSPQLRIAATRRGAKQLSIAD